VFYTFSLGAHQIAKSTVERNLYFAAGSPEITKDLQRVRAQGVGKTDIYADPLFASVGPRDFRLKPGPPALKLGIKQLDISRAGLRPDFPKRLIK
jgi:hypothetical protein